jgi:hypothetical protein
MITIISRKNSKYEGMIVALDESYIDRPLLLLCKGSTSRIIESKWAKERPADDDAAYDILRKAMTSWKLEITPEEWKDL